MKNPDSSKEGGTPPESVPALAVDARSAEERAGAAKQQARLAKRRLKQARRDYKIARKLAKRARKEAKQLQARLVAASKKAAVITRRKSVRKKPFQAKPVPVKPVAPVVPPARVKKKPPVLQRKPAKAEPESRPIAVLAEVFPAVKRPKLRRPQKAAPSPSVLPANPSETKPAPSENHPVPGLSEPTGHQNPPPIDGGV